MSRNFLRHMVFVLLLLCIGCTGNLTSGEEPPDITIARQGFYNEFRAQFAESVKEYISAVPADSPELLPDFTISQLEKAELGEYLDVWELKKGEKMWGVQLDPAKNVTEQIISNNTYRFSIMVEGRAVADYAATIEEGEIRGGSCSKNNKLQCAYDVARANEVDIQQCHLVSGPGGGSMFLFFFDNGKEICSKELKDSMTDLTMSEDNVETFKKRVTAYNQKCHEPLPENNPDSSDISAPAGHTPPFF